MFICNKDVNHTFNYPANHAFPTFYNMSQCAMVHLEAYIKLYELACHM